MRNGIFWECQSTIGAILVYNQSCNAFEVHIFEIHNSINSRVFCIQIQTFQYVGIKNTRHQMEIQFIFTDI